MEPSISLKTELLRNPGITELNLVIQSSDCVDTAGNTPNNCCKEIKLEKLCVEQISFFGDPSAFNLATTKSNVKWEETISGEEVEIGSFYNDQEYSQINPELPGECQRTPGADLFNDTCRSPLSSGTTLERNEKWRKFYAPTKRCNPPEQSKISANPPNSKRHKYSSGADNKQVSAGHRNEVNDVNSQSSVALDITSSLMYPVVHLIKDQCNICKDLFLSNRSLTHLMRHAHVCRIAADKHLVKSDTAIVSTDKIAEKTSEKMTVTESSMRLYSCRVCRERFHCKDDLTKHLTCHTQDTTHLSSQSSDLSKERDGLIERIPTGELSQTGAKKFACTICSFQSNNKCHLSEHMRIHTGEKPFACTMCSFICNRSDNLSSHMLRHSGEKPYACTECSYRCRHSSALSSHMLRHGTGNKPFACTLCAYRCYQSSKLSQHMRIHTGEKRFACSICSFRCNQNNKLSRHMLRHTGEKSFACTLCSYQSNRNYFLSQHMRIHTGEKPFACTTCSYQSSTKCNLSRHMRIQHMSTHNGEKPFACTLCSYRCYKSPHLAEHMLCHTGERPFACTICSFRCNRSPSLSLHMLRHTSEKPFACTLCSFRCNRSNSFSSHMRRHTGEKPYACTQCSYQCRHRGALSAHMLRHHTDRKPFACNVCTTSSDLSIHLLYRHTDKKPFVCTYCTYRGVTNRDLSKHLLRRHTVDT